MDFNDKYVFVGDHFVPFTSHIWPMCALIETGALRKTIFGICLISLYTIKKTAHSRTDVRRSGPEQCVVSAKDVVLAQVDVIRVNKGILIRKALENAQHLDP